MPAPTVPGPLDGADFGGKTKSFTVLPGGKSWPTCGSCGSTFYPSRRQGSKARVIGGSRLNVEKYRCRCGKGHEVRRPLEVAAELDAATRARAASCLHDGPPSPPAAWGAVRLEPAVVLEPAGGGYQRPALGRPTLSVGARSRVGRAGDPLGCLTATDAPRPVVRLGDEAADVLLRVRPVRSGGQRGELALTLN
jgi:hypothetical protein